MSLLQKISQHPELIRTLSALEPSATGCDEEMPMLIGFVSTVSLSAAGEFKCRKERGRQLDTKRHWPLVSQVNGRTEWNEFNPEVTNFSKYYT